MLTFFYSTATCSTACHIALEEAGLPFKGVEVSWRRKVNLEELSAVNPLGQVPVLVDEGRVLNQSPTILEYIADHAKGKNLIPVAGSWERSQANSWLAFIAADLQKSFAPMFWASRWTDNAQAQTAIKSAVVDGIQKHLAYIDGALAGKEFILGQQFSVVDAYLFTIVGWCKWSEIKVSPYPNLMAYLKRIHARPAVQKVLKSEDLVDYLPA